MYSPSHSKVVIQEQRVPVQGFLSILSILLFLLSPFTLLQAQLLDPAYHNNQEIADELYQLAEQYPDYIKVDSIGHSAEFSLPILMAKVGKNVQLNSPQPALLYVGQFHAEEVIGVEITLRIINQLCALKDSLPFRDRLEGLQLYFIPTLNPEGLEIVHSGKDVTFRKNCRDNIGDGLFRSQNRAGYDTSGVDLNRNWDLHWDTGDPLFFIGDQFFIYNYYRGATAFSEPETQTLRDLALKHRFLFSLCYHSSRSGANAETIIGPWSWDGRRPPETSMITSLGFRLVSLTPKQRAEGNYTYTTTTKQTGQSPEWFYWATGCVQYMVEVGEQIQPDSLGLEKVIVDNLPAAYSLMDIALGNEALDGYSRVGVTVTDQNGVPLQARVTIWPFNYPILEPRNTSSENGRFDCFIPAGVVDIRVNAFGYEDSLILAEQAISGGRTDLNVALKAKTVVSCTLKTTSLEDDAPVPSFITLSHLLKKVVYSNAVGDGMHILSIPVGNYDLSVQPVGHLPIQQDIQVSRDTTIVLTTLPTRIVYENDFSAPFFWTKGGDSEDWGIVEADERTVLTESMQGQYPFDAKIWLRFPTTVNLTAGKENVLELVHRPYFEPGADYGILSAGTSHGDIEIARFSKFPTGWETTLIPLPVLPEETLWLTFSVVSDWSTQEDGWLIDHIRIYQADSAPDAISEAVLQPVTELLLDTYPNPFNGRLNISISLPTATLATVELVDANGRTVETVQTGFLNAGQHTLTANFQGLASGTYFVRLTVSGRSLQKKVLLIQ